MDIDSFLQPSSHKKMYDQLFSLCQTKLELLTCYRGLVGQVMDGHIPCRDKIGEICAIDESFCHVRDQRFPR